MDLVAVDTCRRRVYSFLSITWGLIADVDIESEKYRSLGNARFTVGAIARILGNLNTVLGWDVADKGGIKLKLKKVLHYTDMWHIPKIFVIFMY